ISSLRMRMTLRPVPSLVRSWENTNYVMSAEECIRLLKWTSRKCRGAELSQVLSDSAERASSHASTGIDYGGFGQQGGSPEGLSFTTVDVLVAYTNAAQVAAGGEEGMNTLIDLRIARANAAYVNSSVG